MTFHFPIQDLSTFYEGSSYFKLQIILVQSRNPEAESLRPKPYGRNLKAETLSRNLKAEPSGRTFKAQTPYGRNPEPEILMPEH